MHTRQKWDEMNRSSTDRTEDNPLQRNLWRVIGLLKVVEFDHYERMDTNLLSKGTFCTALRLIKEQEEINSRFSNALDLVCDGHFVYGTNDKYLSALLLVLKEAVHDQYDYINWWLYEGAGDYMIWETDNSRTWCLKEPEALYDYITEECQ